MDSHQGRAVGLDVEVRALMMHRGVEELVDRYHRSGPSPFARAIVTDLELRRARRFGLRLLEVHEAGRRKLEKMRIQHLHPELSAGLDVRIHLISLALSYQRSDRRCYHHNLEGRDPARAVRPQQECRSEEHTSELQSPCNL